MFDIFVAVEVTSKTAKNTLLKHKYDLTYELCAEMSSAAYCKVVFVIFLS